VGELDAKSEDFINPGVFAKEAADFIAEGLTKAGWVVKDNFTEDWGRWVEVENPDGFFLAVGVANFDEVERRSVETTTHRAFVEPNTSPITKFFFKKIGTEAQVKKLLGSLRAVLESDPSITDIKLEES